MKISGSAAALMVLAFVLPVSAETRAERRAAAKEAVSEAVAARSIGGTLTGPLALKIEKQNKPEDKLLVEATYANPVAAGYVVELKVVWGDLDNKIKGVGKQYYSKWDGSLELVTGTGSVDHKIQFDDKGGEKLLKFAGATTRRAAATQPQEGSGRDLMVENQGARIEWKAGVVGVLDGVRIRITSATPLVKGTLKAGNFEIPLAIGGAPAGASGAAVPKNRR